ncbi:MAG: chitobiase/beta-hexosaminidase C-terminal domain-containing protein [Steroidobacteraceae bacterium]
MKEGTMYQGRTPKALFTLLTLIATALADCSVASAQASLVFSYPSGFASAGSAIKLAEAASLSGSAIQFMSSSGAHNHASAWYATKQPPGAFTTQFTFTPMGLGSGPDQSGLSFVIQNTGPPGYFGQYGLSYVGDANMDGYGAAIGQNPPVDSIGVKFDAGTGNSGVGQPYPDGGRPNSTGLYFNGGPVIQNGGSLGLLPFNDLNPYGINFYSGDTFQVTIVYDGSLLTMVMKDTTTGAQAREAWPLNLANTTNPTGNYVGIAAGTAAVGYFQVLNWSYWSGYNTRLATPTFSVTPGQYGSTQTVSISAPTGSTIYYTTNGLLPTSASAQYTGALTVSTNTVIQAVAIQSGYTDSLVAQGAYQIGTANIINLASGFSANDGVIPVGYAYKSGSQFVLTDNKVNSFLTGAGWFSDPVNVQGFTSTFQWSGGGAGMCFVVQNNPQPYPSLSNAASVSGGPTVIGSSGTALGYGGVGNAPAVGLLNSVALCFDSRTVPDSVGLYTNGATPTGSQVATGLSFSGGAGQWNVTLTYSGTTLGISMQAASGGPTFTYSWTINIPSTVGANTAYVGFTASTEGGSLQTINSWTYAGSGQQSAAPSPTVPDAPTNLTVQ